MLKDFLSYGLGRRRAVLAGFGCYGSQGGRWLLHQASYNLCKWKVYRKLSDLLTVCSADHKDSHLVSLSFQYSHANKYPVYGKVQYLFSIFSMGTIGMFHMYQFNFPLHEL